MKLREALQAIVECCEEDHAARDYCSRQTEIRGIARAALAEPVADEPVAIPKEHLALNVLHPDCHKAADAFWTYWRDYGETHRHGYYESTWGAINRALRTVGVVEHEYAKDAAAAPAERGEYPPLPDPFQRLYGQEERMAWGNQMRAYVDADRAQRVPSVSDEMVSRFLAWPLPKDFYPDCGISFDGRKDDEWNKNKTWPTGTNLLSAEQARSMLEHVLGMKR